MPAISRVVLATRYVTWRHSSDEGREGRGQTVSCRQGGETELGQESWAGRQETLLGVRLLLPGENIS